MKASPYSALAALLTASILQGLPAFACTESIRSELIQMDRILSRYKQLDRERRAITQGLSAARIPAVCRLTREMADLEREWLDYNRIVKYTCPSFHEYTLKTGSGDPKLFERNYEVSQQIINFCAQRGL